MMLPLQSLVTESYELGLVVAVAIGFAFGFVLERAGFGRATKLAGQFYGTDMTVFKVMFGAVVTAMTGLVLASGVGLVDLQAVSQSAASYTYLWPMLVGGLLLGVGFVVSGYCPGTSMVAAASGHLDGVLAFAGVIVGSLVYGEIQPAIASFHDSGAMGHAFIYELLGIPPAVAAAAVVAMALGGFLAAEKLEGLFSRKFLGQPAAPSPRRPRRFAFATLGVLLVAGLAAMLVPVPTTAETRSARVAELDQATFARRLLDEPWSMRVLDLRSREACAEQRIPRSECVPRGELEQLGLQYAPAARDLVLLDADGLEQLPPAAAGFSGRVWLLRGGFAGWKRFALQAPTPPPADAGDQARRAYRFRAALHRAMTGAPPAPPPPSSVQKFVPKKRRKGGGCS